MIKLSPYFMFKELQIAIRILAKSPAFVAIAVATLALAIGANTAVFSLVNALLIRPLPYAAPQRLVLLWEKFTAQGLERIPVSAPEFVDYEKQTKSYAQIAAFTYRDYNLTGGDVAERVQGAVVSPALWPLLGVQPIRGRTFDQTEQGEGRDNEIVISGRLWERRFNSDSTLVGKTISLNGRTYTVVGIMPKSFEFPLPLFNVQGGQFGERVDVWAPVAFTENEMKSRGSRDYGIIGRLAPGVTASQAQAELNTMVRLWKTQFPNNYGRDENFGAQVYPLHDQVVGGMRPALWILFGAVLLVLLIACANLTTMLLARSSSREREMAIRMALGAGPMRLIRQLLMESVLLSVLGGLAGIMLAVWGLDVLRAVTARTVPRIAEVNLDLTVLGWTFAVAVGTGILFGFFPALASSRPELTEALKQGGRGSTEGSRRNKLRSALVIAEIAIALALLVAASLLVRSFIRIENTDPGFNPGQVLTMELSLPATKYPKGAPVARFFADIQRRVAALPAVKAAAVTSILPLSGNNSDSSFTLEGEMEKPLTTGVYPDEEQRCIGPDYFRVLEVPLLQGRFFTDADTADSTPVVIINQALAKKYWPNGQALGKRITFDDPRKAPKWTTIVGIVGDVRHRAVDEPPRPEFYGPHAQVPYRSMILAVRSSQDPRSLTSAIRREVLAVDPDLPLAHVRTLEEVVSESIAPRRLSVLLLGVFASIALVLAAIGMYGVMSYLVAQRTHEIGVRMALGAQRSDVLKLILSRGVRLVFAGTGFGLLFAFFCTRALRSLLYGVGAFDALTFTVVTLVLAAVALLATYIPAVRATQADPMIALSHNA
ncbi:MAG: ABC transporter permease [Chthoniobacterales bacterium]